MSSAWEVKSYQPESVNLRHERLDLKHLPREDELTT